MHIPTGHISQNNCLTCLRRRRRGCCMQPTGTSDWMSAAQDLLVAQQPACCWLCGPPWSDGNYCTEKCIEMHSRSVGVSLKTAGWAVQACSVHLQNPAQPLSLTMRCKKKSYHQPYHQPSNGLFSVAILAQAFLFICSKCSSELVWNGHGRPSSF